MLSIFCVTKLISTFLSFPNSCNFKTLICPSLGTLSSSTSMKSVWKSQTSSGFDENVCFVRSKVGSLYFPYDFVHSPSFPRNVGIPLPAEIPAPWRFRFKEIGIGLYQIPVNMKMLLNLCMYLEASDASIFLNSTFSVLPQFSSS